MHCFMLNNDITAETAVLLNLKKGIHNIESLYFIKGGLPGHASTRLRKHGQCK